MESVDEHGACLSHVLPIEDKRIDPDGALLRFDDPVETDPKLDYQQIQRLVNEGVFSERMGYCGQEGFNFTPVADSDLRAVRERTDTV